MQERMNARNCFHLKVKRATSVDLDRICRRNLYSSRERNSYHFNKIDFVFPVLSHKRLKIHSQMYLTVKQKYLDNENPRTAISDTRGYILRTR